MRIRIYYEDTDCGGIVYHANYIKYCERARSEKFFSLGLSPTQATNGFVVKALNANFIGSAMLGDEIEVLTKVIKIKHVSVLLKQEIFKIFENTAQKNCRDKIFEMEIKIGYIDFKTTTPALIPENFIKILNEN
ncbi:YbgC/FadM family acyl-CoA thioesterase [Helicobacter sp. 11S03491-1]|uniref:YbgC/FadM family acyl-CoA thioesterase n=1 Tax=Helicobacter sp. 11S03491-1 TaxID=1476196 RepID=UPI000BA62691|nr:YbgC/FadM family acyl-CoA thioesterase [Helicobacter sp. 11S03491-1]PAF42612.1 hypothetical protein BKH45_03615 [Helicobacter sp. 11S03491-1]